MTCRKILKSLLFIAVKVWVFNWKVPWGGGFTRHSCFCQLMEYFPEPHFSSSIMNFYRCDCLQGETENTLNIIRFGLSRHLAAGQLGKSIWASSFCWNLHVLNSTLNVPNGGTWTNKNYLQTQIPVLIHESLFFFFFLSKQTTDELPAMLLQKHGFISCTSHISLLIRWMCIRFPGGLNHTEQFWVKDPLLLLKYLTTDVCIP